MAITVNCPQCDKRYNVPDDKAGRKFRCRSCQGVVQVPDEEYDEYGDEEYDEYEDDAYQDDYEEPAPRRRRPAATRKPTKKAPPPKNNTVLIASIGGGVVALAGVIIAVVLLMGGGDEQDGRTDGGTTVAQNGGGGEANDSSNTNASASDSNASKTGTASNTPGASGQSGTTPGQNSTIARTTGIPGNTGVSTTPGTTPVSGGRSAEDMREAQETLKKLGLAFHNYHETYRSFLPVPGPQNEHYGPDGKRYLSWRVHILPFIGEEKLYEKFKLDEPWDSEHNKQLAQTMPSIYRSPGDPGVSYTTRFRGFAGKSEGGRLTSMFPVDAPIKMAQVVDGTSNTLLLVEAGPDRAIEWTRPDELEFDAANPIASLGKIDPAGVPVLMADGMIGLLRADIPPTELSNLINPQDGNSLTGGFVARFSPRQAPPPPPRRNFQPRQGPVATAYLTEDCIAFMMVRPKAFFQSETVKQLIPADAMKMMGPMRRGNPEEIELMRFWVTATKSDEVYAVVTLANDHTLAEAATIINAQPTEMNQLDARSFLVARPPRLKKITTQGGRNQKLKPLIEAIMDKPGQFLATASVPLALNHPAAREPGVARMLQSPYFAQINQVTSVTLGVDFDQEQFITFRATATSPAIATLLRNTINSAVHQELPPNAPPQAKKMMELVGAATTVEVDAGNNSTVVTTMKKDPALLTAFGQMISSGVMAGQAAAQRAVQRNNLKEVALAMHNYHDAFGSLPIAKNPEWRGSSGPHLSWRVHILPFIGEEVLYKQFRLNEPWDSPHNIKLLDQMPRAFVVPGVQKENHTSIMTFTGAAGLFRDPAPGFRDVRDGTSNTIMVIQAGPDKAVPWTKPEDITANPENPFAAIGTVGPGFHAALCDGQVRFISANIEKGLLNGLINPADGQ